MVAIGNAVMYNTHIMADEVNDIHDKLFYKTFSKIENAKSLLHRTLPETVRDRINFDKIEIDETRFVSDLFKNSYADLVIKSEILDDDGNPRDTDIYLLVDHKSAPELRTFLQILAYEVSMWQKDLAENKPFRIVLPLIFYHGKAKWNYPEEFVDLFDAPEELKRYMTNFRYMLFDTRNWDPWNETDGVLTNNVYAMSVMMLFRVSFFKDLDSALDVVMYQKAHGISGKNKLTEETIAYITHNRDVSYNELNKRIEDLDIDGGEIMASLAQRLENKGVLRTAKRLIQKGIDFATIQEVTDLSLEELKKLSGATHYTSPEDYRNTRSAI